MNRKLIPIAPCTLGACLLLIVCSCARNGIRVSEDHPAHPDATAAPRYEATTDLNFESTSPASMPSEEALYTCPMHPEVISDKPGKCPKCGMNLVILRAKGGSVK